LTTLHVSSEAEKRRNTPAAGNPNPIINEAENPESQPDNKRDRLTTLDVSTRQNGAIAPNNENFGGFQQ